MPDFSENITSTLIMAEKIDPIVVGETISDEHKQRWLLTSRKFHECGLCGEEPQAYPGD